MGETVKLAISTNDYKNLAQDSFGRSHFFLIYRYEGEDWVEEDTRENILFMQACELRGRADHLHGLLNDVDYLIGHHFEAEVESQLSSLGHDLIRLPVLPVEQVFDDLELNGR